MNHFWVPFPVQNVRALTKLLGGQGTCTGWNLRQNMAVRAVGETGGGGGELLGIRMASDSPGEGIPLLSAQTIAKAAPGVAF